MMMVWIQIFQADRTIFLLLTFLQSLWCFRIFVCLRVVSLSHSLNHRTVQKLESMGCSHMSSVLCCISYRIRQRNLTGRTIQKVRSRLARRVAVKQWQVHQLTRLPEGEIQEKEMWSYFSIRFGNCYLQEQHDVCGYCLCSHCEIVESLICLLHQLYLKFGSILSDLFQSTHFWCIKYYRIHLSVALERSQNQ